MLYVYFGTDGIKVREAAHVFLHEREAEGAQIERIQADNYQSGLIEDAAGGASLFGAVQVVLIDTPSEDAALFEKIFELLPLMKESANTFVLVEGTLLAPAKKKLVQYAEKMTEIVGTKTERFNAFLLADALLRRDRKSLWMLLIEARQGGLSDEEIIGTLFWQLKTLRLALVAANAEEAGLKPFVYSKAKSALPKFGSGAIETLSRDLLKLYHEGHAGIRDLDLALERWALSV